MSFKIIAIRPTGNCDIRFLKNLQINEIYKFYNDYAFSVNGKSGQVEEIIFTETIPVDFFNVDRLIKIDPLGGTENTPIKISVSAVVGENGSGKSAISELYIAALFVISNKFGFVVKENFLDERDPEEEENYDNDLPNLLEGIAVEIFYEVNNIIYIFNIDKNTISYKKSESNSGKYKFKDKEIVVTIKGHLPPFFYSMVVNYSFYGFNSNQIGMWIKAFFHKNDGYQMPIVINPYRNKGIMDINTENILTRARVLANVLSIKDYKHINSKSKIRNVELSFNSRKDYSHFKDMTPRFTQSFIMKFRHTILMPLFSRMFNDEYAYPEIDSEVKTYAEIYLIQKLITIPSRYTIFKTFDKRPAKKRQRIDNYNITLKVAKTYAKELHADRSHITLKVRQTLNFLRDNIFKLDSVDRTKILNLHTFELAMEKNYKKNWFTEIIDYLPPPIFASKIQFEDGSYFDDLSSGEKQKIYSLNSIIYHLKNIDSVHKNFGFNKSKGIVAYDAINLIFDEIELYYHPDFQKSIVHELLNFIKSANYEYINSINMIFLTHSPFILSDIPNQNILYLKRGKNISIEHRPQHSFGANITDLLAHSFFVDDGLLGNYAKEKIGITLNWLKMKANEWYKSKAEDGNDNVMKFELDDSIALTFDTPEQEFKYHKQIIEMIDEPLVKNKLRAMYIDYVAGDNYYLDEELKKAEQRVMELKKRKGV